MHFLSTCVLTCALSVAGAELTSDYFLPATWGSEGSATAASEQLQDADAGERQALLGSALRSAMKLSAKPEQAHPELVAHIEPPMDVLASRQLVRITNTAHTRVTAVVQCSKSAWAYIDEPATVKVRVEAKAWAVAQVPARGYRSCQVLTVA